MQVIEDEGYQSFSVEKVARSMGVKSPALYHHFTNRAGLLNEVAPTLLEEVPLDADPVRCDWQEWFVSLSVSTYDLIMRHPRAAALLFTHFPTSSVLPAHERGARILAVVGIAPGDRWVVMRGLEKLVFGLAAADADDLVQKRDHLPHHIDRAALPYGVAAGAAGEQDRRAPLPGWREHRTAITKMILAQYITDARVAGPRADAPLNQKCEQRLRRCSE